MRFFPALFFALVLAVACLSPAGATQRVALVIGNSDYALVPALANPANDAALMAETLRAVGFDVVEAKNADQRAMKRAISDFGRRLEAAGKDGVGLFYYAGHAVEARGVNYLIPLGAPIERQGDLDIEAVSAQWVLTQMEIAGNGLNVVILDSCRNNPYKGSFRAATRGLARMRAPTGSYIAYAAAPGELASDGDGSNSPYTAALAAAIQEPGLKLEDAFKRVRARVHGQTGGKQTPWEEGSVIGDFYFVPQGSTVTVTPPGAPPAQPQPAFDARALELTFWDSIKDSSNPEAFEAYLAQYPNGTFAALARLKIEELKDKETAALTPPASSSSPGIAVTEMEEAYFALKRLDVRAAPGTSSEVVHNFSVGDEISVTGKVSRKDWYRITLADGRIGYVVGVSLREQTSDLSRVAEELERLDMTDEAITLLESLADARPERFEPLFRLGNLMRGKARFEEAVAAYDRAIERLPTPERRHWTMFYFRGIALERLKQWPRAEADFLKALDLEPEQPFVMNYLAYAWIEQNLNVERAKGMLVRAVELRPDDGYIVDSLGWVYYRLGEYGKGLEYLERAVELRPQDPIINDHLGDAYWRVGRRQEARLQWQKSLNLTQEDQTYMTEQEKKETISDISLKIESGIIESQQ